jgi:LPS-assembly protein
VKTLQLISRTALPLLLTMAAASPAQEPAPPVGETPDAIDFTADSLAYDQNADLVTASGDVRMNREGYRLRADTVTWNRVSGEVRAQGNVQVTSPAGDVAYGDSVVLEENLRDGIVQNLLLVLEDGGRLGAVEARREDGLTILNRAAYTPCAVVDADGCPRNPTWQVNAVRVVHDPVRHRITYQNASLSVFGMPIIALPGLSHPDGTQGGGTGLLVPEFRIGRRNGFELSLPYYIRIAPNRDSKNTPQLYTDEQPML